MFPSKRTRHNRNPDSLINHGMSAQSVGAQATEHLSGDAPPRQPGTMPHRTLPREFLRRLGSLAFVPIVVAVLGAIPVSPAAATSQEVAMRQPRVAASTATSSSEPSPPTTQAIQAKPSRKQPPAIVGQPVLQLLPAGGREEVGVGEPLDYTARLLVRLGRYQGPINVTRWTGFQMQPDGSCEKGRNKATCTPKEVGEHTVTATLPPDALPIVRYQLQATAVLRVTDPVVSLELAPPEKEVQAGVAQPYTALTKDRFGNPTDVTGQTDFRIDKGGSCDGASCSATKADKYTVTGTLRDHRPPLSGTATLTVVPGPPESLELAPPEKEVQAGVAQPYTALTKDRFGNPTDVTGQTDFRIDKGGSCDGASCSATKADKYTVTGTLRDHRPPLSGTATLTVVPGPPESLELAPPEKEVQAGVAQPYTALTKDRFGNPTDVTGQTDFRIDKGGSCDGASCSATKADKYTVTGTLRDHRPPLSGT